MTHAPIAAAPLYFFSSLFLVCMAFTSVSEIVWYRILEHIGTLFYYKQDSSMHMTEIIFYDLFIFDIPLGIISAINNSAASANLLFMVYFWGHKFSFKTYMARKCGAKTDFKSLYGTGFCSMCHGYKCQLTVVYQ